MALLTVIFIILFLAAAVGIFFAQRVIFPHRFTRLETWKSEMADSPAQLSEYANYSKEEISIPSPYRYSLQAVWLPYPGAHKTVILVHGITVTHLTTIKYIPLFRRRGFNILLYDQCRHGNSGGHYTTFGYYEKYDLKAAVDWVYRKIGDSAIVGTHGESMGAAVALQHAAVDPRVSFVVADCAFADLTRQLTYRLNYDYKLPAFPAIPLANFYVTLLTGMSFDTVSPLRDAPLIAAPVLFIHGREDRYVPAVNSQDLFDAKTTGIHRVFFAAEAGHAESIRAAPEMYDEQVGNFLEEIGMVG